MGWRDGFGAKKNVRTTSEGENVGAEKNSSKRSKKKVTGGNNRSPKQVVK